MTPYFEDAQVVLYHGDALEILPQLVANGFTADVCIADPPYEETSLEWDRWPAGWPALVLGATRQLWCWGSFRMFLEQAPEFAAWKYGQEIVWEKHNGSNMATGRFRRVHEICAHFYAGPWSELYLEPQFTSDAVARQVCRKNRPSTWGAIGDGTFESHDGGPRQMRSVFVARSMHGRAVCETEKPEAVLAPLISYSCPPGGRILDLFGGSGAASAAARKLGRRSLCIERRLGQCEKIVRRLAQGEIFDGP